MPDTNPITPLLEMYKENTTHGRQHETQRQLVTAGIVALTAALLSAMAALKFHPASLPLALFVILAGFLGRRFSEKFYERFRYHTTMAWSFRKRLDELCPDAQIEICRQRGKSEHAKNFKADSPSRLNEMWLNLNTAVIWLGIVLTGLIVANWVYFRTLGNGHYLFPSN